MEEKKFRQLSSIVFSGMAQATFVCSQKSICYDGLLNFYVDAMRYASSFRNIALNHWAGREINPCALYVIDASEELIDRIAKEIWYVV